MEEIVLAEGVISFDGRVVEFFGFNQEDSLRLHIAQGIHLEFKERKVLGSFIEIQRPNAAPVQLITDFSEVSSDERDSFLNLINSSVF